MNKRINKNSMLKKVQIFLTLVVCVTSIFTCTVPALAADATGAPATAAPANTGGSVSGAVVDIYDEAKDEILIIYDDVLTPVIQALCAIFCLVCIVYVVVQYKKQDRIPWGAVIIAVVALILAIAAPDILRQFIE